MEYYKELDIFGSDIKWRLFKKESFKSKLGASVTLLLSILLCIKLISFNKKFQSFGFIKYKVINEKGRDLTFNLTNFGIKFRFTNFHLDDIEFKLEDYFGIDFYFYDIPNDIIYSQKLEKENCTKYTLNEYQPHESCFKLPQNLKILNLTKNYFFDKYSGNNLDNIQIFKINLKWTSKFNEIFDQFLQKPSLILFYKYSIIDMKSFTFIDIEKSVEIDLDKKINSNIILNMKKIILEEKFDFDFLEINFRNDEKININHSTFDKLKNENYKTNFLYFDFIIQNDLEIHEIISLSLDDILSVMGGFLQILFSLTNFCVGLYNQRGSNKQLNNFCLLNLYDYDRRFINLKTDFNSQKNIIFKDDFVNDLNKTIGDLDLIKFPNEKNQLEKDDKKNNKINDNKLIKEKINDEEIKKVDNVKINKLSLKILKERISTDILEKAESDKSSSSKISCEMSNVKNKIIDYKQAKEKKSFPINPKKNLGIFKNKRTFTNFDFFDFISIDIYLTLLSGFEAFKYFYFDKLNKKNFDKIADLFIFSENCEIFASKESTIQNEKYSIEDPIQKDIFIRLMKIINDY